MHKPFVVFALPRSRTTWLSQFLSFGDWHCGHDELRHCRQLEDVRSWLAQPNTGTVETAAAPFWRLLKHLGPETRIVTIRRDPDEAAISAARAGYGDVETLRFALRKLDHKLGQIEKKTRCRSFAYGDLTSGAVCRDLFEHLLPYKFDVNRWARIDRKNIQTPTAPLLRYVSAHRSQLERLSAIARQKSLSLLAARRGIDRDGVSIDFVPFRDFLRDHDDLIREHIAEVGDHPDTLADKNLPRLQELDDAGLLQVAVGRSNGRAFGYLISAVTDSLTHQGKQWACHTAFYASPAFPGLGLRLRRAADARLAETGVFEVVGRAGVRGDAERQAALYLRDGYEPFGTFFRLQLGGDV